MGNKNKSLIRQRGNAQITGQRHENAALELRSQMGIRFWRALNYLSVFLFIIVVYSGFFLTEYILLREVAAFLAEDVKEFPIIDIWFKNARIGLAFLMMIVAFIHGIIATYEQVKIDRAISAEKQS
jgi:hypothetical protein